MILFRLFKIVWIVVSLGIDEFIPNTMTGRVLKRILAGLFFWRNVEQSLAVRLRLALEALGPIFVKFGQVLSTRRDLPPQEFADELAKLQDQVPPFPGELAEELIVKSLKKSTEAVFSRFDLMPVASASVAQVHYAELLDGRRVAVKVLRPGIQVIIEHDLAILRLVARLIEKFFIDGRRLKLQAVVAEFDKYLHDELDLMHEAANASQIRRNFQCSPILYVPEVFFAYCAKEVLVMEWVDGIPISQIPRLIDAGIDVKYLARLGVEIFFTQVFRDGFFHADMHPGNILVAPNGSYIAIDFGIVGSLTEFDKHYLAINFLAFFNRDYKRVASAHVECGWVPKNTRIEELEAAVRTVCEPIFNKPLADISFGQILLRLFEASRRFQVEIQPQLVLLQKTLLNIEGLGRELDPELDLWQTAKPFLERWMSEQVGWRALIRHIQKEAPGWVSILPALPRQLHELTQLPHTELLLAGYQSFLNEQKKHNRLLMVMIILFSVGIGGGLWWIGHL